MHMGSGGAAGLAHQADYVAARQLLPFFYHDFLHVAVHGDQPLAVVDEHGIAVEEIIADGGHPSRRRGMDGCPGVGGDIQATVGIARFTIEDAAQSERAAYRTLRRQVEA